MDLITKFMNLLAPPTVLITLSLFLPPFYLYKSFLSLLSSLFSEDMTTHKVVLITGTSSGIGEQIAYQYAKKGAFLVLARRDNSLREATDSAKAFGSPDVLVVPADVAKPDECRQFVEAAVSRFEDHLAKNAGIANLCMFEEATDITNFNPLTVK